MIVENLKGLTLNCLKMLQIAINYIFCFHGNHLKKHENPTLKKYKNFIILFALFSQDQHQANK